MSQGLVDIMRGHTLSRKSAHFVDLITILRKNVKYYAKHSTRNLLHANSCVHSRRLIAEFPTDGIKCLEKLKSHFANMTFADKSRYDRTFQQVTHKGGESAISYI